MNTVNQLQKIIKQLSLYQVSLDNSLLFKLTKVCIRNEEDPLKLIAVVGDLQHAAYKAIEEQYAKFDPNASKDEQIKFYKNIIHIKAQLRELEFVHLELTKELNEKKLIYVKNEESISLNEKYILDGLKEKAPKEIVRENYYQLLEKIGENKKLKESDRAFINSLLMQIIARPEGQNLIVKLNWLLETKAAKLNMAPSQEFGCSSSLAGAAKERLDYLDSSLDEPSLKNIIKKATMTSEGTKDVSVLMDMNYLKSMAFLNTESYASPEVGLTDLGPPFILLAHELIHATHNVTGSARGNFNSFYEGIDKTDDYLLGLLYPKESDKKVGDAAEEYWTIEAGQLCENSLRRENGFSDRTGHVSAEPGNDAIRDLYHIGLARNYDPDMLEKLEAHFNEQQKRSPEELEKIDEEDSDVKNILKIEKFQLQICSVPDVIHELKRMSRSVDRSNKIFDKWRNDAPAREHFSPEENWMSLLTTLPITLTKTLMAVCSLNKSGLSQDENIQLWKDALSEMEAKPEDLQKIINSLQTLERAFSSCMPADFKNDHMVSISRFREALEEHTASLQHSFTM
ncbi:M91 family zinc metallopeptidase [Legionella cincinnatiensis]|uniref:Uncharacterized protein n=1 Tax=Legionella cincinnatiensis TaxID=28085 RepID=A0A378IIK6_9GAMM|nr:M91 family zinc metallopeptidase [Legionella cincinnatiensis]KTC81969.1 hypothetical protein Lcin_3039 [Legionella cincinnatiensis]STX34750.1 Uncharacterised protein [Legionella cincinnatiensis]